MVSKIGAALPKLRQGDGGLDLAVHLRALPVLHLQVVPEPPPAAPHLRELPEPKRAEPQLKALAVKCRLVEGAANL
jgi:hypothetical protein